MSGKNATARPNRSSNRPARLKLVGSIVLALGLVSAALVYWRGRRAADWQDDLAMVGYSSAQSRQMGMLYGKMGRLVDDFYDDLQRPGTQAVLIILVSGMFGLGCFYVARGPTDEPEPPQTRK